MEPTLAIIPTGTWNLDPLHSNAGFAIKHQVVNTFRSRFTEVDATLVAEDGSVTLAGTVQVASLDIADEGFRAHLLGDDFFAADRYPAIRFTSRSIARDGDALAVAGELTIKDVTRPVQAHGTMADGAVDPFDNVRLGLTLATTIDRSDFGIAWNRKLVTGGFAIANRVDLTLDLAFIRT